MLKHLIVLLLAVSTFAAAQAPSVPSALLPWAGRSPVEFTMALAHASVPSGLEIREANHVMPSVRPEFSIHRTRRIAAAELVRAFNAQHNDCRAVLMGDVLVIRPLAGRLPFLDQRSTVDSPITVTGAMAAARRVFSQLDTGLLGPVLNSLGRESDEIPILLDGNGTRTVIEMLNQIALQAPSSAWVVTTRHERGEVQVVSFGFLEGNGSRRTQRVRQP